MGTPQGRIQGSCNPCPRRGRWQTDGILNPGCRISLDDLATNAPEEEDFRIDAPAKLVIDLAHGEAGKLPGVDAGNGGESGGL
jgi:hypothetical protein